MHAEVIYNNLGFNLISNNSSKSTKKRKKNSFNDLYKAEIKMKKIRRNREICLTRNEKQSEVNKWTHTVECRYEDSNVTATIRLEIRYRRCRRRPSAGGEAKRDD